MAKGDSLAPAMRAIALRYRHATAFRLASRTPFVTAAQRCNELEILQPDDWHLHLRDGAALALTVNATARVFGVRS
jgi:hypothetical protein